MAISVSSVFRRRSCGTPGSLGAASVLLLILLAVLYAAAQGGRHHADGNSGGSSSSAIEVQAQQGLSEQPKPARGAFRTEVSRPSDGQTAGVDPLAAVPTDIRLQPGRITLGGRQVLYQFPPNSQSSCSDSPAGGLRGVLFLYHGCTRTAMSFFYSPQGRDMMRTALTAGLAVVAFEKEGSCWSPSDDLQVTLDIGTEWIGKYLVSHCGGGNAADGVPTFGFGASSGGSFVAEVAQATTEKPEGSSIGFQLAAINVQIMTPRANIQTPTVFTVMSRDQFTMEGVEHIVRELKAENVPTLLLKTQPKLLTWEYLMNRFQYDPNFTKEIAEGIVGDLRQMGAIAEDGELIQNPRSLDLGPLLAKYQNPTGGAFGVSSELLEMMTPSERDDASELWLVEELNVAHDQHEITHEKFGDVVDFFLLHSRGLVL